MRRPPAPVCVRVSELAPDLAVVGDPGADLAALGECDSTRPDRRHGELPVRFDGPTGAHGLWRLSAGVTSNPSLPRGVCPVVVRTPTDTCYDSSAVPSRPNDKELGEVVIPASAASAGMSSRPEP